VASFSLNHFRSVRGGEDLEMVTVTNLLAGVDMAKWSQDDRS
jgi:hypothetical protein